MARWHIFWNSLSIHIKMTTARSMFQFILVLQPIMMAILSYMIYRHTNNAQNYIYYVVLGSGIAGMWQSIVYTSAGDINRERFNGTLGILLAAPSPFLLIVLGKITANAMLSVVSFLIGLGFSLYVLRVPLTLAHPAAFAGSYLVFLIATNLFALTLSAIFLLSRSTAVMQNFLEYPILIITGIFFPLHMLPGWIQPLSWLLPLTWGADALRQTTQPTWNTGTLLTSCGIELFLVVSYFLCASLLFKLIEYRIRVTASMEVY